MKTVFFFAFLLLYPYLAYSDESIRPGLFVSVIDKRPVLNSREEITELIKFAKKSGIKTLFVQFYRANKAWFPTKASDTSFYRDSLNSVGEDAFALLIRSAHQQGIEVHAWLNLLSLSANKDAPILIKYGLDILTRNVELKRDLEDYKIDNQYFLEPSDPRVKRELLIIISDLLKKYPELDGIQFDYIRYPDSHPFYGYSRHNMELFKRSTRIKDIKEEDPVWKQWKRDNVTRLLTALVKKVRAIRPRMHISTTGCVSYSRSYHEAFQDWPLWVNTGLVEFVTMMNYPADLPEYEKNINVLKTKVNDFKKVNIAVGAYKFIKTPDVFYQQYEVCKKAGARSCVVFYYGNIQENPALGQLLINDYSK